MLLSCFFSGEISCGGSLSLPLWHRGVGMVCCGWTVSDKAENDYQSWKNMYKMVYTRVRALMSVNLFRNSLLNIDSDSVDWLIINPRTLCSPSCAFSPPPHGGGLLCRCGRGHCQCEGSAGDQGRSAAEHCRGAHQHLGAPGWPLRPVLRWDLGEVLLSCEGNLQWSQSSVWSQPSVHTHQMIPHHRHVPSVCKQHNRKEGVVTLFFQT